MRASGSRPPPTLPSAAAGGFAAAAVTAASAAQWNVNVYSEVDPNPSHEDEQQPAHQEQGPPATHSNPSTAPGNPVIASPRFVSFTGFREDDEWRDGHSSGSEDSHTSSGVGAQRTELEVYEQLAQDAGMVVQPALMRSTSVLVARRGFTMKRLLAAHRRIPVVLPRWFEDGCPLVSRTQKGGVWDHVATNEAHAAAPIDDRYAVPWLHGYVFSTTGLTTQEKAAIEKVCAEQHGAVMEASLTYRCDALLTSAECCRGLQELLRREERNTLAGDTSATTRRGGLRVRADAETVSGNLRSGGGGDGSGVLGGDMGSWLTDKIRFALEFGIPVVDYARLLSLLRLDRLPAPSIGLIPASATGEASTGAGSNLNVGAAGTAAWSREVEEALNGNDLDTVIGVCRVAAPAGGASQWRRVFERAAQQANHKDNDKDDDAACVDDERGGEASRGTSLSNSSFSSSSASTVSDPDAWEDFMQHMLVSNGGVADATNTLQPPQPVTLTLNTVDVVVQPDSVEPATLHVSSPDYYSETGALGGVGDIVIGADTCQDADSYRSTGASDFTPFGMSEVDPSPRLTTNALLQRDQPPRPSGNEAPSAADEHPRKDPQCSDFGECIAAYYAAQRSELPASHRMPTSAAPWRVPAGPSCLTTTANARRPHALAPIDTPCSDTLPTTTQVLVESCASADTPRTPSASLAASQAAQASQRQAASRSATPRVHLPLWAIHPPYLSVSLLGCTDAETRRAKRWCGICRCMRLPFPTVETDVVVLGSRVLARKKYVALATHAAVEPKRSGRNLRAAAAAALPNAARVTSKGYAKCRKGGQHDVNAEEGAVCIRYWEMDAEIARVLSDTCGISLSRIAPLQWLEDAAAATQKAAAAAAAPKMKSADRIAGADATLSRTDGDGREMETTTTPQDTLAELLQERLEAARKAEKQQQQQQQQQLLATGGAESASGDQPLFYPFPALLPEQLPSLASPSYYIRLRRSFSTAATATAEGAASESATNASAAITKRGPAPLAASSTHTKAESKPAAPFPFQQQHQPDPVAAESATGSSLSLACPTLSSTPASALTTRHSNHENNSGSSTPLWGERSSELDMPVQHPASPALPTNAQAAASSYDEELATASRRFHHLIALFALEGDGAVSGTTREPGTERHGMDDVAHSRRHALRSCCFCGLEGEYTRVDWAVLRGLVRYGGGRVEKKTAAEWARVCANPKEKRVEHLPSPSTLSHAEPAQGESEDGPADQRRLAARLRCSIQFGKQQRKLARLLLRAEGRTSGGADFDSSHPSKPASSASDSVDPTAMDAVKQLKRKLVNTARVCQQSPVFCLLPHSFQRAPAVLNKNRSASARAQVSDATIAAPPSSSRLHALHDLVHITQDYILACLAVGYCLNPLSCFLFCTSIPSAPDVRLFHARSQQASSKHSHKARVDPEGRFGAMAVPLPTPGKPMLSAWMHEKRYHKPESVGVCIALLWCLPPSNTQWTSVLDTESCTVPSAQLVPLIRVLLLGLRNAVEAMGGHVADAFSSASVTHVVVVGVDSIVSSSLKRMYTTQAAALEETAASTPTSPTAARDAEDEKRRMHAGAEASTYWPASDISEMVRCAARQEISFVSLDWLARCVEWGTFIDEAGFVPPEDIQARIVKWQQRLHAPKLPSRTSTMHTSGQQALRLMSQSIRDDPAARAAEKRKRRRTPSPAPSSSSLYTATVPEASRATAAPHTPPRPWLSTKGDTGEGTLRPSHSFTCAHPAPLQDGNSIRSTAGEGNADNRAHTPVMRRLLPPSASNSNSNLEPCTPPPRPPVPMSHHLQQDLCTVRVDLQQSSPLPPRPQGSVSPSIRSGSHRLPLASGADRRSLSGSTPRRRAAPSASQHNTYSLAEQQDAEAYVERLGSMFNFCSPGSTPLPSSARRGRQHSTAAARDAEHTPLPHSFGSHLLHQVLDQTSLSLPGATQKDPTTGETPREALTPPLNTELPHTETQRERSISGVLSTPRRRTLRTVAAAAAAAIATHAPLSSPRRHRHRAHDSSAALTACSFNETQATDDQRKSRGEEGVTTPVILGGGSTFLSPRGSDRRGQALTNSGSRIEVKLSRRTATVLQTLEQDATCATVEVSPTNPGITAHYGEVDETVWVARTPPSQPLQSAAAAAAFEEPTTTGPSIAEGQRIFCRFSGGSPLSADEATVPLPCPVDVTHPTVHMHAVYDLSLLDDVIPDSQQEGTVAAAAAAAENDVVLVPASPLAATAVAYASLEYSALDEGRVATAGDIASRAGRSLESAEVEQRLVLDAADKGRAEGTQQQGRDTLDICHAMMGVGHSTGALGSRVSRPRLGTCSAPRQSPPPSRPPEGRQTGDFVVDVDAHHSAEERMAEGNVEVVALAGDGSVPPHSPLRGSREPPTSPWATHRPLSLSRRPSRSPVPASQAGLAPEALTQTAVAAAPAAGQPSKRSAGGSKPFCLRIYVVHDMPHRELRVERCLKCLQKFAQGSHSPTTPTLAKQGNSEYSSSLRHASRAQEAGLHDEQTSSADDVLPACFVARCEDADVCVTHEVNLRESVLVAIAQGCWVVQPGFLEFVVGALEGSYPDGDSHHRDGRPSFAGPHALHLLPHPHAPAAPPSSVVSPAVLCYKRLCGMCPTYEWTPATAATSAALSSPMQRSLVLQCRRQRQAAKAVGARSAGGLASIFASKSFVLMCAAFSEREAVTGDGASAANVGGARARAVSRVLSAGGGKILSVVQVGCVRTLQHSAPAAKQREPSSPASETPPLDRGLLRCCMSDDSRKKCSAKRTKMGATARAAVNDVHLYHDLLYLLCNAVHCQSDRDGVAEGEAPYTACATPLPYSRSRSRDHSAAQKPEREHHANSLLVLLDASLLHTAATENASEGRCVVVLTEDRKKAVDEEVPGLSQRSKRSREADFDTDLRAGDNSQTAATPLHKEATTPAERGASCSLGAWLAGWLAPTGSRDDADERGSCYSQAAQHALRSHLSACCSLMRHLDELSSTVKPNAALSYAEERDVNPSLTSVAEAQWSYRVRDIPFGVPTLEEVLRVLHPSGWEQTKRLLSAAALSRLWSCKAHSERRVEFRSTSWVGACVAAGGSAVLAGTTATADFSSRGAFSAHDDCAWVKDWNALTLLAVLSYS
ncbi:hypothetical protein ABL78_5795 [Leptomonas seymouri]|uniref:BRCT domain-containing protein n=1 Tax=Leptomonas seymouri TaxID=5684 RepID=A0A0N1PD96_LEPSE|nr:hypothetical protein ABL78_5795 [Leptomonas seymouri]|eukprot:KPI85135.1 hypothetical protein ABL78_5795 [Leptomonas seymouri]